MIALLTYESWVDLHEEELSTLYHETGAAAELVDYEEFCERRYEETYLKFTKQKEKSNHE